MPRLLEGGLCSLVCLVDVVNTWAVVIDTSSEGDVHLVVQAGQDHWHSMQIHDSPPLERAH